MHKGNYADIVPHVTMTSQTPDRVTAPLPIPQSHDNKDHFQQKTIYFAGTHLILDLWGAKRLDNLSLMRQALRNAVDEAGATLLHIHLHHFTPNGGISGVAVLAESHISVHTWPEKEYAAFDIFMCGDAKPHLAADVFKQYFAPSAVQSSEIMRGQV